MSDHLADRGTDHRTRIYCQTCSDTGRRGHCAPARCYCGHESCYAHASWVDVKRLPPATITPTAKSRAAAAWDDREEDSSWIDKL